MSVWRKTGGKLMFANVLALNKDFPCLKQYIVSHFAHS
jgi:hypothetical protein